MSRAKFIISGQEVTAGGLILYRKTGRAIEILMSFTRNNYEDLGGRVDRTDRDIYQTIAREVEEESNGVITSGEIITRLREAPQFYTPRSKYLIIVLQANEEEGSLQSREFGDRELHDDFERTIDWLPLSTYFKRDCPKNWRLRNKDLNQHLKKLGEPRVPP